MKTEDYVARISQSSPLQLLIINYEMAIEFICEGENYINTNEELFEKSIKKAQKAVVHLMESLDMTYKISETLMSIYIYTNKILVTALFSKDVTKLDEAKKILRELLSSWCEIEKEDQNNLPLMNNSQKLYAGLTYRNGKLSEFIDEDRSKGYSV